MSNGARSGLTGFVAGEARSKIRAWFKKEKREENIAEGKQSFERELRRYLINIPADKYDAFVEEIAKRQHLNSVEEMYASLGYGGLLMSRLMPKIREEYQKLQKADEPPDDTVEVITPTKRKAIEGVIVEGLDNCLVKFARCCNPLPGDDIVGFITRGHGVSIHKRECTNVAAARELGDESMRWINVSWADNVKEDFKSTLEISCLDRNGLIADISSALSSLHIPIYTFATNVRGEHAHIVTTIGINSKEHLDSVIAKLKKIKDVEYIQRTGL